MSEEQGEKTQYVIELNEVERMSMEMICANVFDWIDNVAKNRARIAFDDVTKREASRRLDEGLPIPNKEQLLREVHEKTMKERAKARGILETEGHIM